ncbi:MAG: vanadium-dependent haloperoxidase [Ferruginibacter sp.]
MKYLNNYLAKKYLLMLSIATFTISGCKKDDWFQVKDHNEQLKQTYDYPSDVAIKWMDMQLRLIRTNATPLGGLMPGRYFGYCGIALYESVLPGMPAYRTLSGQLSSMPAMPSLPATQPMPSMQGMQPITPGFACHWPTCANTALAYMNRNFFPNTSIANKMSMDSLENALNSTYQNEVSAEVFQRSVVFGKAVAQLIFDWSKTDGAADVYPLYESPSGPGLWVPTLPAFAPATLPNWGSNRLMVPGSLDGTVPAPPPAYSTHLSSDYYKMVREVYDISQNLSTEQKEIALYYRDNPGYGDGHYLSILMQVLQQKGSMLDIAAITYAKAGIACVEAGKGCWRVKYQYNLERPITFITGTMNRSSWLPLISTPAFPEYTSEHSTVGAAFSTIMAGIFGANCYFTNRTYDYLDMRPRFYNTFDDMENEISVSGLYAGIHYRISCERGLKAGKKIGLNIENILKFLK